jgi:hypothetical protein
MTDISPYTLGHMDAVVTSSGDSVIAFAVANDFESSTTGGQIQVYRNKLGFTTAVTNQSQAPEGFRLLQNYPNPCNPATNLEFRISTPEFVSLKVYDILGREVSTLVHEVKMPGTYTAKFDASGLASGVYLYRLEAGTFAETRKLILLR